MPPAASTKPNQWKGTVDTLDINGAFNLKLQNRLNLEAGSERVSSAAHAGRPWAAASTCKISFWDKAGITSKGSAQNLHVTRLHNFYTPPIEHNLVLGGDWVWRTVKTRAASSTSADKAATSSFGQRPEKQTAFGTFRARPAHPFPKRPHRQHRWKATPASAKLTVRSASPNSSATTSTTPPSAARSMLAFPIWARSNPLCRHSPRHCRPSERDRHHRRLTPVRLPSTATSTSKPITAGPTVPSTSVRAAASTPPPLSGKLNLNVANLEVFRNFLPVGQTSKAV